MNIQLPKRLLAIAQLVPPGNHVADVGSDHGLLAVFLVKSGISPAVIATDISEKALLRTKLRVTRHGLGGQITCRCGDGLAAIESNRVQTVVVAGLGGQVICDILEGAAPLDHVILQPMQATERLRSFLAQHGYAIINEQIALDHGRYYEIIAAIPGQMQAAASELDWLVGNQLKQRRHPLLPGLIQSRIRTLQRAAEAAVHARTEVGRQAQERIFACIQRYEEEMEQCRLWM